MKKNLIKIYCILMIILAAGCQEIKQSASATIEDYLSSYQNLEYQILVDMETVITSEDYLTDDQKEVYRQILKKQYQDLAYEIVHEAYNEDEAVLKVQIEVYDYYKASKEASEYLKNNVEEFNTDDKYDLEKYMDYKLGLYQKTVDKIEYEIEFDLVKEDGIWKLYEVSASNLEKIHGIYNYEE